MEDYAAKMQLKTEAALREYVTGYAQYREAAVLAALDELRRRGRPAPEEAALRPLLEPAAAAEAQAEAARQQALAAEAAAETEAEADDAPTGPALYSPVAILFFSLFSPFPPLAGGVLLGLNLGFLKRWRALLGLVGVLALYALGLWQLWRMGVSALTLELLKLPVILLYLLWFWPRYVAVKSFRSRSWLPPLLACLAVGFIMAWQLVHSIPGFADKTPRQQQEALQELLQKQK
jgi:hypothetical protein